MRRAVVLTVAGATLAVAVLLAIGGVGDDPNKLTNWQALALGVVQGFTELLPISSSGHLILVPWLFDWTYLEQNDAFNQTFDVSLHLGTCIAVGAYFWHDVVELVRAWLGTLRSRSISTPSERLAWAVVIGTIPAALVGFALEDVIADHLGDPWQMAILLAVFGLLLGWADRKPADDGLDRVTVRKGLWVGLAQCLALMPGVSRSGITITASRFLGLDRDASARFSFLLLLPITLGAVLFKGLTDVVLADLPSGTTGPFVVGVLASLGTGLIAILGLLDYVRRHTYDVFVVYRVALAIAILLCIATGFRSATF
ncbi:undecaprenyl-diphosphate phosphatase [Gaiella sp.]|uniref:undecaprenyl-diphosphate phosphatase n=1 Tax=Gaiella sp. TaxID=2663207 RepID=UPI002E2F0E47|nr:undecaprenyl-diphosphate phosphatase [Gaiella sp.]HEX5583718.1 undecaprenyl-diphosphate phosphatase [Gaiella sp.]